MRYIKTGAIRKEFKKFGWEIDEGALERMDDAVYKLILKLVRSVHIKNSTVSKENVGLYT